MDDSGWIESRRQLRAFIAARLDPPDAVDDVVQDVLLKMVKSIGTLDDLTKLDAWAYQIARNAIIDEYRRRGRQADLTTRIELPPEATTDLASEPLLTAERIELGQCLKPMLNTLDDPYRQAIILTGFDGLTQSQAAATAEISLTAMKSRILRGRTQLLEQLQKCCTIETDDHGPYAQTIKSEEATPSRCNCTATP